MSELENTPESIPENTANSSDPYTYYAGKPVAAPIPRYEPVYKKKKKKLP